MKINPDLISPCGLYCGVCAIYIAHRDNNRKLKERLVNLYKGGVSGKGILPNSENLTIEDIKCRGCLSDEQFMHCRQCEIRACTREKGYTGCHGAPRAKPVVPPCSSAESAEAYPPTHKASEGYPLRIHPRP